MVIADRAQTGRAFKALGLMCAVGISAPLSANSELSQPSLVELLEARLIDSVSVSPDGQTVAFRVISRSVSENATTVSWQTVPVDASRPAVTWGQPRAPTWFPLYDSVDEDQSQWSGDSRSLFVLAEDAAGRQVHEITAGGVDTRITNDSADVVSFKVSADGTTLKYNVRNSREAIASAQAREERNGIHLDRTLVLEGLRLTRNFQTATGTTTIRRQSDGYAVPAYSGEERERSLRFSPSVRPALARTSEELSYISSNVPGDLDRSLSFNRARVSVRLKQVAPPQQVLQLGVYQLVATMPDGSERACEASFCQGFTFVVKSIALNDDTGEVVILHEKDFSSQTVVYGWNPSTGKARTIYAADGALSGSAGGGLAYSGKACPRAGRYLICVRAAANRPPYLVRIDTSTGDVATLADPNAALASKDFGETQFLSWTDSEGRPANGILTLPRHRTGRVPLVISTYGCRGFLRGGTASVASEYMLAQSGIASLCVNNVLSNIKFDANGKDIPLSLHKASMDAYLTAIDLLANKGLIDRGKVGISGHSYSSNVIAYALSHTKAFSAAVLGTGVAIDPSAYFITAPMSDSWRKSILIGLPRPTDDPRGVWKEVSPALNARNVQAAVLMQPPESEYMFGLQFYNAVQDAGGTVDMYIYPNEGHMVGRLPSHQYWRNRRSLEWFAFWLQGKESGDADTAAQFAHWRSLRDARDARSATINQR